MMYIKEIKSCLWYFTMIIIGILFAFIVVLLYDEYYQHNINICTENNPNIQCNFGTIQYHEDKDKCICETSDGIYIIWFANQQETLYRF